jgi:hypothetical protein
MTTQRWEFRDEDLRRYTVEVDHGLWASNHVITFNGREVFSGRRFFDSGSRHPFDVEGHAAVLRTRSRGLSYAFDLSVDGIPVSPQGTTIPRLAPVTTTPVTNTRPTIETPATGSVGMRSALEDRVRNGGRWFYWIAGLSAVNFVISNLGSSGGFALGTAIDWVLRAILLLLAGPSVAWIAHVVVIAFFAFIGVRATAGAQWAFIVGGIVYALDGLIFLLSGDWLGIAVHAIALFAIVSGTRAVRQLRSAPSATTLPSS